MSHIAEDTIPPALISRRIFTRSLYEILEKDDSGAPKYFDSTLENRTDSTLLYRIPEHQRWPQWAKPKLRKLVDSVFKNFTIQCVILSKHYDTREYFDFEDGQTRLSVLQDYYNDGFTYCGYLFSELTTNQQHRFENYQITIEELSNASDDDIHEMFERCQEGSPLKNYDKFWNRKELGAVHFACQLIRSAPWRHEYMGTRDFSSKKRQRLPDVVGLIIALVCENGQNYITSSFRRLYAQLNTTMDAEAIQKIHTFLQFYFKIIDTTYEELPMIETLYYNAAGTIKVRKERRLKFWHIGGYLGMILWDYLQYPDEAELVKQARWVQIINIDRQVPDFLRGKKTIWNGLPSRLISSCDATTANIASRVERMRAFSASETMGNRNAYCEQLGIIWELNADSSDSEDDSSIGSSSESSSATTAAESPCLRQSRGRATSQRTGSLYH